MIALLLALATLPLATAGAPAPCAEPTRQDGAPAARLKSAPDKRVELDFQHYYDVPEIASALASLAAAYPEFVEVDSIGKSAGGRDLWLATVCARAQGEAGARPAIALVSGMTDGDVVGTEMSLYALYDLLQNHARDARAGELFGRVTLYLLPCVDPDRRAELFAGRARAADTAGTGGALDRDFPTAWDPWGPGAGPYPLSTPETRALVDCLLARPNIALVLSTAAGRVAPSVREDVPVEDRAAFDRVLETLASARGGLTVLGAHRMPRVRGSLAEFALLELGAFPFEVRTAAGEGVPPPSEILDLGRDHTRALLELSAALPKLALEGLAFTRLKSDLWQVEFELVNAAALGGTTRLGRGRGLVDELALGLAGGKLIALGTRVGDAPDFSPHAASNAPASGNGLLVPLPALDGGGRLRLRLMVQAAAGSNVVLRCVGARYGAVEARTILE